MQFLVIDDNPFDRELIIRDITRLFPDAKFVEVLDQSGFDDVLQALDYTIIFTDYQLKWTTGLDVLKAIRAQDPELPVIMITDTGNEEIATEAMKLGLSDYLLKTHLARLPITIQECLTKRRLHQEHLQLEAQLQKAQKMESLGLLVSGIAHDFNNILGAILGYAQQGKQRIDPKHSVYQNLQHIQERAEQGARMTRQLLAFARGTALDPTHFNLNSQLTALLDFLDKLLGPTIELNFYGDPELSEIYADPTQLEQVLVNLCLNARDAMPRGGTVTIRTKNIPAPADPQLPTASDSVLLTIEDTGIGMDEQVQARLFEPFFTTKDVGQGTGLGLAVVYGIVKQHQGTIQVQSSAGKGTTFLLNFPASHASLAPSLELSPQQASKNTTQGNAETILLVEDDPDIQLVVSELLHEYGYTIFVASNGEEGMQLFEQHESSISLVIADIMMPKMQGREFQEHIRRKNPTISVLVVSGYQEMDLQRRELLDPRSSFMQKPFDLDEFVAKVQSLL